MLIVASISPSFASEPDWQPKRTWVFAIGVLEWKAKNQFANFPKKGRRDAELIEFFRAAGVPQEQVVFLIDQKATREAILSALDRQLAQTREGDLLIFYYAGHGVRAADAKGPTCLANYDMTSTATGLAVPTVIDAIEKHFKGSRVLLTADCCHSGALGVEAGKRRSRIAYATLASVEPAGTSTGNWTFTETLLRGLRGDPAVDANADGKITLAELADFTEEELAFAEGQLAYHAASAGFKGDAVLALTDKKSAPADAALTKGKDRFIEIEWQGQWWRGQVLKRRDKDSFVRYVGFGPEWDEWVKPNRTRSLKLAEITPKTPVQIEWGGQWWRGHVIANKLGLHQVHYEGFGDEWDEWVAPKRVRPAVPSRP